MSRPTRVELHTHLDAAIHAQLLALIEETAAVEGHRPVGEHKYAHLRVGAPDWVGALAYDADDRLVGYAHTRWNAPGEVPRMAVEVVAHPHLAGEGVARALLEEVQGFLGQAGGGVLWLWVHRVEDARTTLAARLGFGVQRELAFMQRRLDERPRVELPAGVEVRPYREGRDDDAFLEVNNAAFAGHPENGGWDRSTFARRRQLPWFDPDGLLLAWRGDEPLGFHWTKWHAHDSDEVPAHEPVGEVYVLGVHPRAQGMGLGRALLDIGLAHLFDRGCRLAILYVDCASEGAVRLYAKNGFETVYREVCYEREVVAAHPGPEPELQRPAER
jgi:mycothiol synthase